MDSHGKRIKFVSNMSTSEEEYSNDEEYKPSFSQRENNGKRPTRVPKVFSKNANMARENRLRKKQHLMDLEREVTNLKQENKKLSTVVDNQSFLIGDLKKEIKYLKSVIANSSDISNLIRNIHQNTGMSVSTSLDKSLSLKNKYVSKPVPIARKTAHPWDENEQISNFISPNMMSITPPYEQDSVDAFSADFLNTIDIPLELPNEELLNTIASDSESFLSNCLEDHDYSNKDKNEDGQEDIGVCLHVSRKRVSLEFCSSCSDNAMQTWST